MKVYKEKGRIGDVKTYTVTETIETEVTVDERKVNRTLNEVATIDSQIERLTAQITDLEAQKTEKLEAIADELKILDEIKAQQEEA